MYIGLKVKLESLNAVVGIPPLLCIRGFVNVLEGTLLGVLIGVLCPGIGELYVGEDITDVAPDAVLLLFSL